MANSKSVIHVTEKGKLHELPFGHKQFNNGPHICVDVPDGLSTISAKTSEGRVVTFAFCPYRENGPPQCVDIQTHDTGATVENGDKLLDVMQVIGFSVGSTAFRSSYRDKEKPCSLVSVMLYRAMEAAEFRTAISRPE